MKSSLLEGLTTIAKAVDPDLTLSIQLNEVFGTYAHNHITLNEELIIKDAEKRNLDVDMLAICVLAHEIGHHLAGHTPQEVTVKRLLFMEYQAWQFGRRVVKTLEESFPGLVALFDEDNKRNMQAYCYKYIDNDKACFSTYMNFERMMEEAS